eukprot:s3454_g3.t1
MFMLRRVRMQPAMSFVQVMEYLEVIGLMRIQAYQQMLRLRLQVVEYLGVIGLMCIKAYLQMLGLLLQVLEYLGVIGLTLLQNYLRMLGLLLQVLEYLGVIGLIPVKVRLQMLGLLLQVLEYLGVIGLIPVKVGLQMLVLLLQVVEYLGVIGLTSVQRYLLRTRRHQGVLPLGLMIRLLLQVVEYLGVIGSLLAFRKRRKLGSVQEWMLPVRVVPQCLNHMFQVIHWARARSQVELDVLLVTIRELVDELVKGERAGSTELRGVPVRIIGVVWPHPVQDAKDVTTRRRRMCEVVFFVEAQEIFYMVSVMETTCTESAPWKRPTE